LIFGNGGHDELSFAVDFYHSAHQLLAMHSDGTGSGPDGPAGQVNVLKDVAGIQVNTL
jgi:hypothetical protein